MNRAPQSVWHFLLNAKVKQFFNIQKKNGRVFYKTISKIMSLRNTLTYQRGKLPPAAVNRMALVWENIPAYIYMVWFFFYNFAAK